MKKENEMKEDEMDKSNTDIIDSKKNGVERSEPMEIDKIDEKVKLDTANIKEEPRTEGTDATGNKFIII